MTTPTTPETITTPSGTHQVVAPSRHEWSTGQVDYRRDPSAGNTIPSGGDTRDDPNSHAAAIVTPPDMTWKAYDSPEDAMRFNGVNSPKEQAAIFSAPPETAHGWSDG